MPTIPRGIKAVVEGYSIGAPSGVERIPVAGGMARYALQWERGLDPVQVTINLTPEQLSIWTAFFHHVIHKGTVAFDMPLDTGFGVATHSVKIVPGSYSGPRRDGQITTVTFTAEVESAAYGLTEAAAVSLIASWNGYAAGSGTPEIPRGMQPITTGYSFDGPPGAFRSDLPGGAPGYAMLTNRDPQQYRVTLVMESAEKFKVWTAFFHHVLKKGSQLFVMPLDSGFGLSDHTVSMIPGTYSATRNGVLTVVSFGVEAESEVYDMTAAEAEALVDFWNEMGDGTDLLLARIAQFANVDTLVLQ